MISAVQRQIRREQPRRQEAYRIDVGAAQQRHDVRPVVPLADAVHQHANADAARHGRVQRIDEPAAHRVGLKNVAGQPDRMARFGNGAQHSRKRDLTVVKRLEAVARQQRQSGQHIADALQGSQSDGPRRLGSAKLMLGVELDLWRHMPAHPIDAEQPVQHRATQREQPAQGNPAHCTARIGLGQQGMQGRCRRAAEINDDEQVARESAKRNVSHRRDEIPRAR